MTNAERYIEIKKTIPSKITLIAVSKTHDANSILNVYDAGCRDFGENKVQEMQQKADVLPKDIRWHMLGHLQTNKVKFIAPFVHLIHSVDSLNLLSVINKEAKKLDRTINCLLQFHIAKEETKFGLSIEEAHQILESEEYKTFKNISINGIMAIATFTDNETVINEEYSKAYGYFTELRDKYFGESTTFSTVSLGMSGDYNLAIQKGSTMVRLGTIIFGERSYMQKQ